MFDKKISKVIVRELDMNINEAVKDEKPVEVTISHRKRWNDSVFVKKCIKGHLLKTGPRSTNVLFFQRQSTKISYCYGLAVHSLHLYGDPESILMMLRRYDYLT